MASDGQTTSVVAPGSANALNEESLQGWLSTALQLEPAAAAPTISKFNTGQSNPTYLITLRNGEQYVLRKKPAGELVPSAHRIDREYKVLAALATVGYPVPPVKQYCADKSVLGAEFYLMGFAKGRLFDNGLDMAPRGERKQIHFAMIDALAALHSVDPHKVGLSDYGKMGGFYSRQIKTMKRVSEAQVGATRGVVPQFQRGEELLAWFESNLPPDIVTVVHGDYKPDNIVIDEHDGSKVLAVLDWELSTIGHPLSDLANMCLPYYIPDGVPAGTLYSKFAEGAATEEELVGRYCKAQGINYPPPGWLFCVAFSFFRLAVILQGVACRLSRNQASSNAFTTTGAATLADMLVEVAFMVIQGDDYEGA